MSVWGCVGKIGAGYMKHLNLGLAKEMMSSARKMPGPEGGAYGAATAFNKWSRGYVKTGQSTWKDVAARRGTLIGMGATAGAVGGGLLERARQKRKRRLMGYAGPGNY